MRLPDFLVLGHVTKDVVNGSFRLGGTATYSAITASKLGRRVGVVTSASSDLDLGTTFQGIEVRCLNSPVTTTFENTYSGAMRTQLVRAVARRLTTKDLPPDWLDVPVVHLGPVAQELDAGLCCAFPRALVGLTPQGWMRSWNHKGRVHPKRWKEAPNVLPYIGVLILSEKDVPHRDVIAAYCKMVPVVVLTQGRRGARVHWEGEWHHVPPFQAVEKDPTGAGDAFAAAYLIHYAQIGNPLAAALFANCVASFAIEEEGVKGLPTLEQVEERMAALT